MRWQCLCAWEDGSWWTITFLFRSAYISPGKSWSVHQIWVSLSQFWVILLFDHMHKLQERWDHLNKFDNIAFMISEKQFKRIIAVSLPTSWNTYIQPYIGKRKGDTSNKEAKYNIGIHDFIGMIKEEYKHWAQIKRKDGKELKKAKHTLFFQGLSNGKRKFGDDLSLDIGPPTKGPFRNRIQGAPPIMSSLQCCWHCSKTGHCSGDCWFRPKNKCTNCGIFNHKAQDCRKPKRGVLGQPLNYLLKA